ncbi:MAG TPA: glycosyltransferase family 4 protein [Gemmataceae bacterium]|jgi:glycosyltransferase involved in cell wall biosynthesis|nr:glycosyltransferase family 4 protein [Gemmataceae bacterium]
MQIAHFIQRYPPALGGSEAYFQRLSQYLGDHSHSVSVWTTTALDLEAFWSRRGRELPAGLDEEHGVEVHRFPLSRWPLRRYMLKAASFFPERTWQCLTMRCNPISFGMWKATTKAPRLDVVHATAFPYAWPIVCARRLARRQGIPFLLTPFLHLGDPEDDGDRTRRSYTSPALASLLHSADRIFVQTPSEHDAVLALGVPESRVVLHGLGVEPAECTGGNRQRIRKEWNLGADETVVGHLANLSYEKGTMDLLQASARAWNGGAKFRLVLAGPNMPNFRRFWDQFEFQARVQLTAQLDDRQKRDFFAGIDLFALPSRSDSFGLVLLEAWANGVPNIAYRAGGIADVIQHERDGILVKCGDVDALAAQMMRLVQTPKMRRRLGEHGRERVHCDFRWADKLALVEGVYQEVVDASRHLAEISSLADNTNIR